MCIKKRNTKRARGFAIQEMDQLSPSLFKRRFQIDHPMFVEVLEKISPHIRTRNEVKACNSSSAPIVLKTRLAVTL
jgi:hypothetical protein